MTDEEIREEVARLLYGMCTRGGQLWSAAVRNRGADIWRNRADAVIDLVRTLDQGGAE